MNLLFLVHSRSNNTGWGRYADDLISGLEGAGHNITVIEEEVWGLAIFKSAIKARKYIKNCDIIHAIDVYPYGVIAYFANLFLGKKLVISAQGTYAIAPLYNFKAIYNLDYGIPSDLHKAEDSEHIDLDGNHQLVITPSSAFVSGNFGISFGLLFAGVCTDSTVVCGETSVVTPIS
jgi:hypothetical protein